MPLLIAITKMKRSNLPELFLLVINKIKIGTSGANKIKNYTIRVSPFVVIKITCIWLPIIKENRFYPVMWGSIIGPIFNYFMAGT